MNIFGAFTFGGLIKTFLPGFVWLLALGIVLVDCDRFFDLKIDPWAFISDKDRATLVVALAITACILFGVLSNVIVFMGVNDWMVRRPVRKANQDLFAIHDHLAKRVRDQSWTILASQPGIDQAKFDGHIDQEMILLERLGVDTMSYVREQYWYHLEFQLNLMLSIVVLSLALAAAAFRNGFCDGVGIAGLWIVIGALASAGLIKSARKNYCRHVGKMASLMTAVLTQPQAAPQTTP